MIQYPLHFQIESAAKEGIQSLWTSTASGQSATCAIPPEFEGPGGGFSPEDFFGLAAVNCFVATFKVIAEKSRLSFESIRVSADLKVDRNEKGQPWMAELAFKVQVKPGSADRERLERALQKASGACLVLHSLKTAVNFDIQFI
jgi:organic hydroperoxide reductase OsmC/OhrA